ncbi:MAG: hypothetical protein AAF549_05190 [Pseudomonadota bacterium]
MKTSTKHIITLSTSFTLVFIAILLTLIFMQAKPESVEDFLITENAVQNPQDDFDNLNE